MTSERQPDSAEEWYNAAELDAWNLKTESEHRVEVERGEYLVVAEQMFPKDCWIVSGMEELVDRYHLAEEDLSLQVDRLDSRSEAVRSISMIAGLMNRRFFDSK